MVRKPHGETALERLSGRWEDNIKMDLREIRMRMWITFN
jgi:hypothetical protein